MIVGAGSVYDTEVSAAASAAGAKFLTTDGLDLSIIEFANKEEIAVWPAALTPTGSDHRLEGRPGFREGVSLRSRRRRNVRRNLKKAIAHVPLIAAGGVNQQTAQKFILRERRRSEWEENSFPRMRSGSSNRNAFANWRSDSCASSKTAVVIWRH